MAAIEKRSSRDLQEMDRSHHLHPFTDHKELHVQRSRIISRAEGVYIYEGSGHKILDGMSGLWCVNAGYGRQEIIDAATEQMKELPYYNSFFQCSHPPAIELASLLKELSQPHLNRVFFAGSGSESNDTIIRMVRTYWDLMGQPGRHTIISRNNAYHGSTVAAASLSGMKAMHKQSGLPIPGIVHVEQPYWYGSDQSLSPEEFGLQAARSIEAKIQELGAEKVAAFIGEPVQGAGGVIVPPSTYWPEVQRICDEYGILLISDEVITGFAALVNGSAPITSGPGLISCRLPKASRRATYRWAAYTSVTALLMCLLRRRASFFMAIRIPVTRCRALSHSPTSS